jgi:hypothetical protein
VKKGDVVQGTGTMGLCRAKVIGFSGPNVRVEWQDGVLAGREALVPKDMLCAQAAQEVAAG